MYDSEGGLYASDEDDKSTPVFVPVAARNLAGSAWKNRRKEFEDLLPSQFRLVTSPEEWERECKSNKFRPTIECSACGEVVSDTTIVTIVHKARNPSCRCFRYNVPWSMRFVEFKSLLKHSYTLVESGAFQRLPGDPHLPARRVEGQEQLGSVADLQARRRHCTPRARRTTIASHCPRQSIVPQRGLRALAGAGLSGFE
jgi:hypothetical protein